MNEVCYNFLERYVFTLPQNGIDGLNGVIFGGFACNQRGNCFVYLHGEYSLIHRRVILSSRKLAM